MNALVLHSANATAGEGKVLPFAEVQVTLSKQEHVALVWAANYWQAQHGQTARRLHELEARYEQRLREVTQQAAEREAALVSQIDTLRGKVRDLKQRLFGRKSERRKGGSERQGRGAAARVPRGQQRGTSGHGRRREAQLPEEVEVVGLDSPCCPDCGLELRPFPGTEDSEVLEIEVRAYRRKICRRRYRAQCNCGRLPGIVAAPPPPRLIARGKLGLSVWEQVLLDKFLYGRPSHRLLRELADYGVPIAPGTLAGGLQALVPLFAPLDQAWVAQLRRQAHWHADETRWAVFVEQLGKIGHRWYLWVFHAPTVVHYVLDPSRATKVVEGELVGVESGVISCDRYSAYKKFARLHPGVLLAFCWAHQRRDFLVLANAHPALLSWAMGWVDAIGELYHRNGQRLQAAAGSVERAAQQAALEQAVEQLASRRDAALADPQLAPPAAAVLQSMARHWPGLTLFVAHPWVPMDNSAAERDARLPVVGRKNFYGSGAKWAGQLAALMYSLFMTFSLWQINPRTWLRAYLQACADQGNRAPADLTPFLPWAMDAARLAAMRACPAGFDTS